jgi:hypothetical protein
LYDDKQNKIHSKNISENIVLEENKNKIITLENNNISIIETGAFT